VLRTFALQAAVLALALIITGPGATVEHPAPRATQIRLPASEEPTQLRCRLYFGCAPASQTGVPNDRI